MAVEIVFRGKDETGRAVSGVVEGLDKVDGAADKADSKLGGFLGGLGKVGLIAGGAMAGGIAFAAKAGLDFNNSIEQVTAKLNAFTKDGNVTAAMLEDIKKEAATTPFAFEEMAQATAALMSSAKGANVPVMDLVKQAEILAASNPAQGLEGAAFALKEAAGGDFTSIIERFDLPRQRINELKAQGVPALEAVSIAMKEMGLDADLVSNMAGTMEGRWSTFMDTFTNVAAAVTQPIFDALSGGLASVQTALDANQPAIEAFAQSLASGIGSAIQWLIGTGIPMLIAGWQAIQPAIQGGIAGFQSVIPIISAVAGIIMANLPAAMQAGAAAFQYIQGIVQSVMPGILAVVSTVLATVLAFWQQNGSEIMAFVQQTWTTVGQIFQVAAALIGQILSMIAGFIQQHGSTIQSILQGAWMVISNVIKAALAIIQGVVTAALAILRGDWSGAWQAIQTMSSTVVQAILGIIEGGMKLIGGAVDLGIAAIKGAWQNLIDAAPGIGDGIIGGIVNGISSGVGALKDAVTSAANSALQAAKDALGIHSPSRVFRDQIGWPVVQGLLQPLRAGASDVAAAGAGLAAAAYGGASAATQRVDVRSSIDLNLRGDLPKLIDARAEKTMRGAFDGGLVRGRLG